MTLQTSYGYADVGRFGLGHGMLAWARCVVWCHDHGAQVLAPRWLRLRIGPLLRRERDKRFYAKLFRPGPHQWGALRRSWLLSTRRKVNVVDLAAAPPAPGGAVVVFTNRLSGNEEAHFHEIVGRHTLVKPLLLAMTRPRFQPVPIGRPHIAIHVRGGDFSQPAGLDTLRQGAHNQRLPVSWFVEMLAGVRARLQFDLAAIVYSDCSDAELQPLLAVQSVRRSTTTESVTDMLAMSEASVQISSGSGFSRWGAYLGAVPRICFPGQRHYRVLGPIDPSGLDREPEALTADELSEAFISLVRHRCGAMPRVTAAEAT